MPRRYETLPGGDSVSVPLRLGTALRRRLRYGYSRDDLRSALLPASRFFGILPCALEKLPSLA